MNAVVSPTNVRIEQSGAIGPQIHRALRQQIIRGQLLPGVRLSELDCASSFSVSRQPIREAFIKLSEEGLVEIRPQRGTLVRRISEQAVLEARFIREAIEADIVKRVVATGDGAVIRELRVQLKQQREVSFATPSEFMALDELFHRTLAAAAGIEHAWKLIEGIKAQMDRVRYLSVDQMRQPKLVAQHVAIVDAIEQQDEERAEAAIRTHLRQLLHDLSQIRLDHADLFEQNANEES